MRDLRPDVPEAFIGSSNARSTAIRRGAIAASASWSRACASRWTRSPAQRRPPSPRPRPNRAAGSVRHLCRRRGDRLLAMLVVALIVWTRSIDAVVARTAVTRVAVLALQGDLRATRACAYLADELTDQLISTLGQIGSLQVPSLTSVMQFRDRSASMVEIGKSCASTTSSRPRCSWCGERTATRIACASTPG